jgi:hypothetical protein
MANTTRIADLPIQNDSGSLQNVLETSDQGNYAPINIHPNPYGVSDKNPIMDNPVSLERPQQQHQHQQQQQHQSMSENYRNMISAQEPQELPSRDIPMDNGGYTHDQAVQPNYIPQSHVPDYLENYADEEQKARKYETGKHQKKMMDVIIEETQLAIFVAILFFIFHTSAFKKLIWNHMTFLPILNGDGNLNVNGIIFKSFMFGSVFYTTQKLATYLSDI